MPPPSQPKILVTGGSGFVGSAVIGLLTRRSIGITALVNRHSPLVDQAIRCVSGGLFDPAALDKAMQNVTAVIHLVGIIRENPRRGVTFHHIHVEGTQALLEAARRNGVRRFIHMSALGSRPDASSQYHQTKYLAEESVRQSGLDWTILRPSLIHGPGGEFMQMEFAWVAGKAPPYLFMPYFGAGLLGRGGAGELQPVYVEDVARAFTDSIDRSATIAHVYDIGGTQRLTWPMLHRTVALAILGRPRPVVAIPAWWAKLLTRVAPSALLPFNRDQVIMSQEPNTCDMTEFVRDFSFTPEGFSESLSHYIQAIHDAPAH
jgi:uncharacterized protein YbjT (DUF2867 family)